MTEQRFPPGWDEERVREVLHSTRARPRTSSSRRSRRRESEGMTWMAIPTELVPEVRAFSGACRVRERAFGPTIIDPSNPGGPLVAGQAELVSLRGGRGVGRLTFVEHKLTWLDEFEHFVFQLQADGTRKAIRKATDEDIKRFRAPIWIQGEEIPICCGREMVFVGQIDDNEIYTERPEDARLWWHDAASFYAFTCPQCLECMAVGQQF